MNVSTPADLAEPRLTGRLPTGVRDLAPAAAHEVFTVQRTLLEILERHGYHRVMTPSFDTAEGARAYRVAEGGLFQLLDPETGEVLALRADVTPQVARLVATQLDPADAPFRLCYGAQVFRPRAHHGISPREIHQAGAELVGEPGAEADVELLGLALSCLEALGLRGVALTVGHPGILNGLLAAARDHAGAEVAARVAACCRLRDRSGAVRALAGTGPALARAFEQVLLGVGELDEVAPIAEALPSGAARAAWDELRGTLRLARECLPDARLVVDLAAERGLDYYTGLSFQGIAPGAGRALLSGGRYDDLLARYGRDLPAVGFAVDEEAVLEALVAQGVQPRLPPRDVLVVGRGAAAARLAGELRALPAAVSVVVSLHEENWRELPPAALADRMARRRFRLVVFVDEAAGSGEPALTLARADGTRASAAREDVLASATVPPNA